MLNNNWSLISVRFMGSNGTHVMGVEQQLEHSLCQNVGNTVPPVVLSAEQSCSIVPNCSIGKHAPSVVTRDVNS